MTPLRDPMREIDWGKVLSVSGVIAAAWAGLQFVFLPLIERALKRILKPELEALADASTKVTRCADEMEEIGEVVRLIDEDVGTLFASVRANREVLLDMNQVLPRVAGADRREVERRNNPDIPQLPERRRIHRRRDDS